MEKIKTFQYGWVWRASNKGKGDMYFEQKKLLAQIKEKEVKKINLTVCTSQSKIYEIRLKK